MADDRVAITDEELSKLKFDVLKEKVDDISQQLGDPGRYFASFKAKDLLDHADCERIKAEITSIEKATKLISMLDNRKGRKGEHPYDVLASALKKMRVHVHIVRILNEELAKKKSELKAIKRHTYTTTNGGVAITSSPTSSHSSSSVSTTPSSHLPSPHGDTSSSRSSFSSKEEQPFSYDKGQLFMCQEDQEATPMTYTDGPVPSLPPGFNEDGSRQTDLSSMLEDNVHPDIGPIPPPPPTSSVDLSHDQMTSHDHMSHVYSVPYGTQVSDNPMMTELFHNKKVLEQSLLEKDELLKEAYQQLEEKSVRIAELQAELMRLNEEREMIMKENNHYKLTCRRLDSFIQQLRGGHGTTPPSISPNRMCPSGYPTRRATEPHGIFNPSPDTQQHRISDPGINLQVPSNGSLQRPNKLYLGKTLVTHPETSPYENGVDYRINSWQKQSPSSDTSKDGHIRTMNSSLDDLSDRSSYESFSSGNLSGGAKGTVV